MWAAKGVVFFSWSIDDPSTGRLHGTMVRRIGPGCEGSRPHRHGQAGRGGGNRVVSLSRSRPWTDPPAPRPRAFPHGMPDAERRAPAPGRSTRPRTRCFMRTFSSGAGTALALLITGAVMATPARAMVQYDAEDKLGVQTYGGNSDNLPVRPSLRWEDAVAWARTMPAVQLAMRTCAGRGYEPLSVHDSAFVSIDPPGTVVIFPYRRPGLVLPQSHYGQPLVMVVTTLAPDGFPSTRVTAGVVIVDAQNNAAFTADSLPQY